MPPTRLQAASALPRAILRRSFPFLVVRGAITRESTGGLSRELQSACTPRLIHTRLAQRFRAFGDGQKANFLNKDCESVGNGFELLEIEACP
jgi:hypothetical protein